MENPAMSVDAVAEHVCNVPLCVRVDENHLRVGTQTSNLAWAVDQGRHRGPRPQAVIDRAELSLLIRRYLLDGGDPNLCPWVDGSLPDADQLPMF